MLEGVRNNASVIRFGSDALHGVCFTRASLTVRKYSPIKTVKNCVNQGCEGFCVQIILLGVAVVHRVEGEGFNGIRWT